MVFLILSISQTTYNLTTQKAFFMYKRILKIFLYSTIALFFTYCASSSQKTNKSKKTEKNEIAQLEKKVAELEYVIKSNSKGEGYVEQELIYNDMETNVSDNNKSLQVLKSKINYLEKELGKLNLAPGSWDNPFSIYNKKILMDNGTMYYGNIIYQDDYTVTLETLIGRLNLERNRIQRVYAHRAGEDDIEILPTVDFDLSDIEDGNVIYQQPAEIILLGNINSHIDDTGNTVLGGQVQNIGGKRADFVKLNMTLYRDWSETLPPKSFTVFVEGSTHYFTPDSSKMSNSSIEPNAIADFQLIIPKQFGTLMSWKYDIDFEQYD